MTAASAGGGGCHDGTTEERGTSIEMVNACFTPTTLFAEPGDRITFTNRDGFAHNVTANGWGYFDDLGTGEQFSTSFSDEGVFPYACTLHSGMTGAIVVGQGDDGAGVAAVAPAPSRRHRPPPRGDRWVAAGLFGLVLGAAAGAGLTRIRHRSRERTIEAQVT